MSVYIYVFSENIDGPIKVGYTEDIPERLKGMQCGNSTELKFRFAVDCGCGETAQLIEEKIHKALRFYWMRGEWFSPQAFSYLKVIINDLVSGRELIKDYNYFGIKQTQFFP
ncbi:GIY-YIG nuclease family protein, partial [Patescibacteria group bacterium]|nr:GIY-YIG nuclease family protein [Patescibacteria group bacterium]